MFSYIKSNWKLVLGSMAVAVFVLRWGQSQPEGSKAEKITSKVLGF